METSTTAPGPRPGGASAARALAVLAWRQVRTGAVLVLVVSAGVSASIASTHERVFADPASAAGLQSIAANPAIRTLFGAPVALGDPGGFTVWRAGTVTAVLLSTWVVLATTRTTRAQEEVGRWPLLLAGPLTARTASSWTLLTLAAVPIACGAAVSASLVAVGTRPAGALVHGAGTAAVGLFSLALAACCAQLFGSRAGATGAAVGVLGAGLLLLRMVADGVETLAWLRWFSPFGLLELSRPFVRDRPAPLLVLLIVAVALAACALLALAHRDVGEGLLRQRSDRAARLGLLGSVEAFALRRGLRALAGWSAGIGAYYLLLGLTAVSVTGFLAGDSGVARMAERAGFGALERVEGFSAAVFSLLAIPVGAFAAARMAALAAAEDERRLVLLCAGPLGRLRLLGAEVAATAAGVAVLSTLAGVA
ncbi:polyketide antibiotic transporter, partial [Kineococcus vitellinus]|uniref:polyketide antibiotic transporter n=1 Tax=Kineococcus vitellinus TaxID=2696565 RepID=UPI001412CE07